jgi:rhodanese-related sulfurtransferase
MEKKLLRCIALIMSTAVLVIGVGSAAAFEQITAQEAYDMVNSGQATLIDVRTLQEAVWVGSPALVPGGNPIAYLIPWQFWTGVDENGISTYEPNDVFNELIEQTFGDDKGQALITMCRSGHRSTYAAERLEELGYTNVYEIDNPLKEISNHLGGNGGFQGSDYKGAYDGYRGYPDRLPVNSNPWKITVETKTYKINNPDDSVSWIDTGLPVTQKIDLDKIPQ